MRKRLNPDGQDGRISRISHFTLKKEYNMRTKLTKITLAAILGLAITFTLNACGPSKQQLERREQMKQDMQAYEATRDSLKAIYKQDTVIMVKIRDKEFPIAINDRLDTLKTMYEQDTVVMVKIGDKEYKTILDTDIPLDHVNEHIKNDYVWMAENLNIEIGNSVCYDNKEENCNQCGRLYDRETAFKACPEGWRLPDEKYWKSLVKVEIKGGIGMIIDIMKAGLPESLDGGADLKAKSGWDNNGNGNDKYGFSALPCGALYVNRKTCNNKGVCIGKDEANFRGYGSSASFWFPGNGPMVVANSKGETAIMDARADYMKLNSNSDKLEKTGGDMQNMFSVRCVKRISRDLQFIPKKVETQANPQEATSEPEEATAPSDVPAEAQTREGE
jgi:uncharacterized protein (TIGR02145 family)